MPWVIDREWRGEWEQAPRTEHALIAHLDPDRLRNGEVVWSLIYVDLTVAAHGVRAVQAAAAYHAMPKFKNAPAAAALDAGTGGQPSTPSAGVEGTQPQGDTPCDTESTAATETVGFTSIPTDARPTTPSSTSSGTTNSTNSQDASSSKSSSLHPTTRGATTSSSASSTSSEERRRRLRERFADLNDQTQRTFKALEINPDDLDAIEAALDALDPFTTVTEPAPVRPQVAAPDTPRPVDQTTLTHLVEQVAASPVKDLVNRWLSEGHTHGHAWSPKAAPYVHNYERARAALKLAMACSDDTYTRCDDALVREFLRAATGDPAAEWPGLPVGAVIGQLTTDQAIRASQLADAFGDLVGVIWTDNGPQLTGTERVAA